MDRIIVFPRFLFQKMLFLLAESPQRIVMSKLGIAEQKGDVRYLVRSIEPANSRKKLSGRYISVSTTAEFFSLSDWITNLPDPNVVGYLILGRENCEGHWWGAMTDSSGDMLPKIGRAHV